MSYELGPDENGVFKLNPDWSEVTESQELPPAQVVLATIETDGSVTSVDLSSK